MTGKAGPHTVLALETSCDETAAAVIADGRIVLSDVIASQAGLHARYGGVVPEVAARRHIETMIPVVDQALAEASMCLADIDAVAVTAGPGLIGALLVGLSAAKGLSLATGKPFVGVHHLAGHIAANYLADPDWQPPFVCLVVSGGHSNLVLVNDYMCFRTLARTRDDAAGEALDKVARAIGLGYPGGPRIDRCSEGGRVDKLTLPRTDFPDSLDFSFSGLKTAAVQQFEHFRRDAARAARNAGQPETDDAWQAICSMADFAASFQNAVVQVLVDRSFAALEQTGCRKLAVAGGVAANRTLRAELQSRAETSGIALSIPPMRLCTDNAAMVGSAAEYALRHGRRDGYDLNARAVWTLEDWADGKAEAS